MATRPTLTLNRATGAKPALVAATTSDDYDCGTGIFACISVGATATTITVVDPRSMENGAAVPDIVIGPVTSQEVWIPLTRNLADGTGRVTITLSQAASVTCACVNAVV